MMLLSVHSNAGTDVRAAALAVVAVAVVNIDIGIGIRGPDFTCVSTFQRG